MANQASRDISPPFVNFFKNLMLVCDTHETSCVIKASHERFTYRHIHL